MGKHFWTLKDGFSLQNNFQNVKKYVRSYE